MKTNNDTERTHAVLNLEGATCGSCVYTIEHVGKKISGVHDLFVDVPQQKIHVEYDGNSESLSAIISVIKRLGYSAYLPGELQEKDSQERHEWKP